MSPPRTLASLLLALVAAPACGSDDTAEVVPADVPRVTATSTCVAFAAESRVLGVSPEGDLWYVEGGTNQTKVLDATGAERPGATRVDDASMVLPWTATASALIVDGGLWTTSDRGREFLATPTELGRIGQLCGDPSAERGAFVGTDAGLFQRLGGFWWRWTPAGGTGFGTARQLVRNDGACVGKDEALWLVNTDNQLWRIAPTAAEVVAEDVSVAAAAGAEGAAAIAGERLVLGPPWHDVEFASGTPRRVAGGGASLWVQVGDFVYQRVDGSWRIIDGMAAGATGVLPHAAAGAWFTYADKVCHATLGAPLVIRGLLPYEHRTVATADLTVSSGAAQLTVERDGAAVATFTGEGEHRLVGFDLGAGGWHALTVRAGDASRRLDYEVIDLPVRSWEADVKPLFTQSCAGVGCHGPNPVNNQVDLSTYQAWRSRAGRIRERLLRGQMPPVPPALTPDSLAIVLDWIEGGMKP